MSTGIAIIRCVFTLCCGSSETLHCNCCSVLLLTRLAEMSVVEAVGVMLLVVVLVGVLRQVLFRASEE